MDDQKLEQLLKDLNASDEERYLFQTRLQLLFEPELELMIKCALDQTSPETKQKFRRLVGEMNQHQHNGYGSHEHDGKKDQAVAAQKVERMEVVLTKKTDDPKFGAVAEGFGSTEDCVKRSLEGREFEKRLEQEKPRAKENAPKMVIPPWMRG